MSTALFAITTSDFHLKKFGLIGFPLEHSFSGKYFTEKFHRENLADCSYDNFPIENISELPSIIELNPDLVGLNVTIPYKEQVIPFLNELDSTAKEVGAVNTIKISDGKTIGFNTDIYGFMQSLLPLLKTLHSHALVLGTGGSSKAVAFGLKKMGIDFRFVSRNPEIQNELNYADLDKDLIRLHKIIINCTPVGMFPNIDECLPLPFEYLTPSHLLFDLIYNPEETLFLQKGKAQGAKTKNGIEMLQLQAEKSWEIWNI